MAENKSTSRKNLFVELEKHPSILSFLEGREDLSNLFDLLPELSKERNKLYKKLYKDIGNTPVYTLPLKNDNKLYIKLECDNQMGNNHYSRYWLIHLALAEAFKIIIPFETNIIEVTSGSSGISLSMACQKLGYQLTIIVPEILPKGRIQPMEKAGAVVVKAPGYIDACIEKLKEFLLVDDYYAANHSEEKSNLITYVFSRIATEQIKTYGVPDIGILGLGNGTSTEAVARTFKDAKKDIKIYSYYPAFDSKQIIFGLYGPNVNLKHISSAKELVDEMFYTSDLEIEEMSLDFRNDPIISNLGVSSLYAIKLAQILADRTEGLTYFSIGYDNINRYQNG
jgi:cysteine synthase